MNQSVKINTAQARPIVAMTFPEYRGRKFRVEFTATMTFYDTNWDGGTKNTYAAVRSDGKHERLPTFSPWNNPVEGRKIDLPTDVLIVEHSHFCGTDCGITIYAHPCNLPRWITTSKETRP